MLAAGRRRAPRGAAVVALLAVAAVTARVAAAADADDFFSPLAPLLSPIISSVCKTVACGKGNCTVESGTVLGYRCECDPGWTQMHVGDSLRFLPCVVPNCTIDRACSNDSSAPAPAPLPTPKNFSLDDPCQFAYCGTGGTCRKGSALSYHCECKEGFGNLLNITSMPCFRNCSIGADCASIGILSSSTNSSNSPASPGSESVSNNGSSAFPGSISLKFLVPLLLLVSLAVCQAM